MELRSILLTGVTLLTLATASGCSRQEFKGIYDGIRYDGDGGGRIFINGRGYKIGGINADTLKTEEEYTFELTDSPFGEYISNVKPAKPKVDPKNIT